MSRPVALVTGASRGVGAAVVHALAEDGFDVFGVYRRDRTAADETGRRAVALGARCVMHPADLSAAAAPEQIVAALVDEFGRVDAVVHAAGVVSSGKPVAETTDAEVEKLLGVHLKAPFALTRECIPRLRVSGQGAVVFVSSSVTQHMRANGAPYNIAKAAMEALARTVAAEERDRGVRINIVSPGLIDTELGRRFIRAAHGVEIDRLAPLLPFGRLCTPEDVAAVVRWLVSPGASYVSGENIRVNGGDDSISSDVDATRVALHKLESGKAPL